jgi:hypothetical protein
MGLVWRADEVPFWELIRSGNLLGMGDLRDVVPLGMRCYHLPAGFARGSCGIIWTDSPRFLFRRAVLCRQVFGVCR